MDSIDSEPQLMVNKLDELSGKNLGTISMADNNEQSITIQLELPSNETNLQSANNLGSLLIPGYLLVKSSTDSGTYQLQQTVMAINVDNDCNSTNIDSIDNIDLSTITTCVDIPDIETQTSIAGPLEQIVLTSNHVTNTNNAITGVLTRSRTKKGTPIGANKKKTEKCLVNDKIKDLTNTEKVNNPIDKNKSTTSPLVVEQKQKTIKKSNQTEIHGQKTEKRLPPSRLVRVNCPVCNKEFKKTYLKEHMKIHEEDKPYKCLTCGKTYRYTSY